MNAAQLFDHWRTVHRDLMRALALLDDEDLDFRPAESYPRSIGGILRHIINLEQGWIHFVIRRAIPAWPQEDEETYNSVAMLRQGLNESFEQTMEYMATVPIEDFNRIVQVPGDGTPKLGWILWHVFEQEVHHRGELFLCLDLMGKQRPKLDRPS